MKTPNQGDPGTKNPLVFFPLVDGQQLKYVWPQKGPVKSGRASCCIYVDLGDFRD